MPICNECTVHDHKQHQNMRIEEVEAQHRQELEIIINSCKNVIPVCEEESIKLTSYLTDLQMQCDSVRIHIEKTFNIYRNMLIKKQVRQMLIIML